MDLKATVTKNTALLYKRAGVFDRAAELFRMAAEMEDGVANAPRRSAPLPQASHHPLTVQPRALHACSASPLLLQLFLRAQILNSRSLPGTSLLLAASAYASHGHHLATSECAMQALLTTTATLFLPCQRRPEISQAGNCIRQCPVFKMSHNHSQLSDLEAARVIVLSHYHIGTHAPQRSALAL